MDIIKNHSNFWFKRIALWLILFSGLVWVFLAFLIYQQWQIWLEYQLSSSYMSNQLAIAPLVSTGGRASVSNKLYLGIAQIYTGSPNKTDGGLVFADSNQAGMAVVLTNDGWLGTTDKAVKMSKIKYQVVISRKIYPVETVVIDSFTHTAFLKIKAENLPVVAIMEAASVDLGASLTGVFFKDNQPSLKVFQLVNKYYRIVDTVSDSESTDSIQRFWMVDGGDDKTMPLFASNGTLAGFNYSSASQDNLVLPAQYFSSILPQITKSQAVEHLSLNWRYIDQRYLVTAGDEKSTNGMFLISVGKNKELKAGDIILGIDGDILQPGDYLNELLMNYSSGDTLDLLINRGGEEMNVEVKLP